MKINWGTGIVLAFIGFIGFILYFVIQAATNQNTNHQLVTEDYYEEELAYQKEIDAAELGKEFAPDFQFTRVEDGLRIFIPQAVRAQNIDGNISLYRPSNENLDFSSTANLRSEYLLIPHKRLENGRWDIKIRWNYQGSDYLVKESIQY